MEPCQKPQKPLRFCFYLIIIIYTAVNMHRIDIYHRILLSPWTSFVVEQRRRDHCIGEYDVCPILEARALRAGLLQTHAYMSITTTISL
jgi:hypothetical protein